MGGFVYRLSRAAKTPLHALARRAAKSYIAGSRLSDVMGVAERLAAEGLRSTVGFWDAVGAEPAAVFAAYREALVALGDSRRDTLSFDQVSLAGLLRGDVGIARARSEATGNSAPFRRDGAGIGRSDVESGRGGGASRAPISAARCRPAGGAVPTTPIGRPAADWRCEWSKASGPIRPMPTLDPRRGFEAIIERLSGRARMVAVASHDLRTARAALKRLADAGTPTSLELLYGLPLRRQIRLATRISACRRESICPTARPICRIACRS